MHSSSTTSRIAAFTLVLITAGYGLFEARTLLAGPLLSVESPNNGALVYGTLYEVRGKASQVSRVSINGRTASLDSSGRFAEPFLTPKGGGMLIIRAEDRFGRMSEEHIEIHGEPLIGSAGR